MNLYANKSAVSVIIPVYNAASTLKKSITSVLKQNMSKLEIICIDDGSMDESVQMIKSMQKIHPQIVLLEQEHQGSGPARNLGILKAKGDFIAFLDADDEFVEPDALEKMVTACIVHHADICGSLRLVVENGKEKDAGLFKDFNIPDNGCFISYKDFQHDYDYQSFIFNKDFLRKNNVCFPAYIRYQDPPFFLKAMALAEKFYVLPVILYRYYYDFLKQANLNKYIDDILNGVRDTFDIAASCGYQDLLKKIEERVEVRYREAALQNLSDSVMLSLLSINKISRQYLGRNLEILSYIYKSVHDIPDLAYSHDLMKKIVLVLQTEQGFLPFFKAHGIRSAAVYGLGVYGKILLKELDRCGIEVVCGMDQSVSLYENIPVIHPEDTVPPCDALIISLMKPAEIVHAYESLVTARIYTFVQIIEEVYMYYFNK